jgi:YbbR domain-containing protein
MTFVRDLLFRNWGLKLIAFGLALVLWLILVPQDKIISEKTLSVPLELESIPAGMEVVEKPVADIEITVRAAKRILGEIMPSTVSAHIDLGRATTYQQEYPLNKAMITLPPGAEVIEIRPNKVLIKLEMTKQAVLEVHPSVRGRVAAGFRIQRIDVSPSQVTVNGPESRLKTKDTVATAPIDVTGLNQTTVFEADLILPKPDLRLVSAHTRARVTVFIEQDKENAKSGPPRKK